MLRFFSPTGFNFLFSEIKYSESRILRIMGFHGGCRGYLMFGVLAAVVLNQDLRVQLHDSIALL
jgi:hypothetical protein